MDGGFNIQELTALIQDALAWGQQHLLVVANLVQLAVVAAAYFVAHLADRPLLRALDKTLSAAWAAKFRYQTAQIVGPLMMPLAWLVLVGTAQLAALQLAASSSVLAIAASSSTMSSNT